MVGDMNEEREGDGVAGDWRASGPLTAGVGEAARGVTERDLANTKIAEDLREIFSTAFVSGVTTT